MATLRKGLGNTKTKLSTLERRQSSLESKVVTEVRKLQSGAIMNDYLEHSGRYRGDIDLEFWRRPEGVRVPDRHKDYLGCIEAVVLKRVEEVILVDLIALPSVDEDPCDVLLIITRRAFPGTRRIATAIARRVLFAAEQRAFLIVEQG